MSKALNVVRLPTPQEWDRLGRAFMDAEHDINQLLCMADLALHVYVHELEGQPISEAHSPLQTILENVQGLAKQVRRRLYDCD